MRGRVTYDRTGKIGTYFINDVEVTKEEYDAAFPSKLVLGESMTPGVHLPAGWPMYSEAMAVHPKQIEEATARNKRHGVNVGYLPDGRAVLMDAGQKRELMRVEGFHDRNGGYGHS